MAPKTHFTVPLNKAADKVSPSERGRRATRITEKIRLDHPSQRGTSSKPSGSHHQVHKHAAPVTDKEIGETVETYPLQFTEPHYDADDIADVKDNDPSSKVRAGRPIRTIHSLMSHRHRWANGLKSEQDISIFCWRMKDLLGNPHAPCVTIQWMSNAQTVLGGTTFAGIVPFNLISAHHSIGWPAGQGATLPLSHCIHLVLCCFLGMMVCHAHSL